MSRELRILAWDYIRQNSDMKAQSALLLLAIADKLEDQQAQIRTGERTVARWVGRSPEWVRRHRQQLVDRNLLQRITAYSPGVAAVWQLFPEVYSPHTPGVALPEDASSLDTAHTGGSASAHTVVTHSAHTVVTTNRREPEEPKTTSKEQSVGLELVDGFDSDDEALRHLLEVFGGEVLAS